MAEKEKRKKPLNQKARTKLKIHKREPCGYVKEEGMTQLDLCKSFVL